MHIDIEIRHVTKAGSNLFLELGFPPKEASRLQAASRKRIRSAIVARTSASEHGKRSPERHDIAKPDEPHRT
ncbi:Uncharacterised protein [Delftia tsuruhatensis]|nr:Uncharacterised protein [Delftia tsuruhatensis]CAC9676706.1 Uncharacterised protein [Delftia tsuruhatensis]